MEVKTYAPKDFSWTKWRAKDIAPLGKYALEAIKRDHEKVKATLKAERTFENTVLLLERGSKEGERVRLAQFLMEVSPDKGIRQAARKMAEDYSRRVVDLIYDEGVYKALKEYAAKKEKLKGEKKKLFKDMMRSYKRMGFDLPKGKRQILKRNLKKLSKLGIAFQKNINDYKDQIALTKEETKGLSEHFLSGLKKDKAGRYLVTLEYPDIGPFMENSPADKKRKELADKNARKGGPKNLSILSEMIRLRYRNAKLLGYKSFAHYVIEDRLAKKPETVMKLLKNIVGKTEKRAVKEKEEVAKIKRQITGNKKARYEYYDGYYANQLKKKLFAVDNEKVREYFPFEKVKKGLFATYQKLFGVKFKRLHGYPLWHKDVEIYAVAEKGKIISYFLMDLYPREGKYGHACASELVFGRVEKEKGREVYIAPMGCLVCNFPRPSKEIPPLLSHGEVETFFHEFGHIMHLVLSKTRFASQSGFNVAWDFVEAPSQMLENWTWDKRMLKRLSAHYQTGKSLPDGLINKIIKAKKFMLASHYVRQMFLSLFDMGIHLENQKKKLNETYRSMIKKMMGFDLPQNQLMPAGFGHIGGGGYAAGYYSYIWAEIYAADLFTRFKKEGLLNPKTGRDYRKWILEKGASMEEMDLIKEFLKRKPNNKAFLKEIGVTK